MYIFPTPSGPITYQQPQNHFAPQTPSPLRTSRNANLMSPPKWSSTSPPKWSSTSPLDTKSSPLAPYASSHQRSQLESQQCRRASTPPIFSSSSTSTSNANTWSNFASRSRASTAQATLSAQNSAAKDRRKTLFRDKIRKQRDDARFEGRGDQVLRMDFVKERREWEERLARKAPAQVDQLDENIADEEMAEGGDLHGAAEEGIEPPIEEEEIEALAQYLVDREDEDLQTREEATDTHWQQREQIPFFDLNPSSRHDVGGSYGSDEEDYDQLFMEVISASQEQDVSAQESAQQQWQGASGLDRHPDYPSSSMDLS